MAEEDAFDEILGTVTTKSSDEHDPLDDEVG
jgi:hypothetical protein